jgi:hypothetical protein
MVALAAHCARLVQNGKQLLVSAHPKFMGQGAAAGWVPQAPLPLQVPPGTNMSLAHEGAPHAAATVPAAAI